MKTVSDAQADLGSLSALLSLDESAQRAQPLRCWSAAQQDAVKDRFAALVRAWEEEWLPSKGIPDLQDVKVSTAQAGQAAPETSACWSYDDAQAQVPQRTTSAAVAALTRRLFDFDPVALVAMRNIPQITLAVAQAALDDWLERVRQALGATLLVERNDQDRRQTSAAGAWSGALDIGLSWCDGVWRLGMPYPAVLTVLGMERTPPRVARPASSKPVSLERALEKRRLQVRVVLDDTQLSLGQLRELRVGDVVGLAHRLEAPAVLVAVDGTRICEAWLGQHSGHVAVELGAGSTAAPGGDNFHSNHHPAKGQSNDTSR